MPAKHSVGRGAEGRSEPGERGGVSALPQAVGERLFDPRVHPQVFAEEPVRVVRGDLDAHGRVALVNALTCLPFSPYKRSEVGNYRLPSGERPWGLWISTCWIFIQGEGSQRPSCWTILT